MLVAVDAVLRRHLGELVGAYERPLLVVRTPLRECTRRNRRIPHRTVVEPAVVGVEHLAEAAARPLAVIAEEVRLLRLVPSLWRLHAEVLEQLAEVSLVEPVADAGEGVERVDVELVQRLLHVGHIDLALRVRDMPRDAGEAPGHRVDRHGAHLAVLVHEIRADQKLLRLTVDQAVRVRTADGFGTDDFPLVGRNLVELVAAANRTVRSVGDDPQTPRPRHDRARTAFALLVAVRK